jgi:hypothetical protein
LDSPKSNGTELGDVVVLLLVRKSIHVLLTVGSRSQRR